MFLSKLPKGLMDRWKSNVQDITSTDTARTCRKRRVFKICQGKDQSALYCDKVKSKKPSDDDQRKLMNRLDA